MMRTNGREDDMMRTNGREDDMIRTNASEDGTGDAIVYVPVPQYLLPIVYRVLAQALTDPATVILGADDAGAQRAMIDLIVAAAREPALAADTQPVALTALYDAYRRAYPSIGMGVTRASFERCVVAHCINVPARFPDATAPRQAAVWLAQPLFKRVATGDYMLLSDEERGRFRRCVDADSAVVYAEAYDIADLVPPAGASPGAERS